MSLRKAALLPTYALAVAAFTNPLSTVANESYQNLTLAQAIQVAVQNNKLNKVSEKKQQHAESQYQEALSARWPTVDFQAVHQYSNNPMTFEIPQMNVDLGALGGILQAALAPLPVPNTINIPSNTVKMIGNTTNRASLNAKLPIYTGGKISSIIKQADVGKSIANEEAKKTTQQVIYEVKQYYYGVQLSKGIYQVANGTYELLAYSKKLAEASYQDDVGTVTKLDFNRLQNAVSLADNMRQDFTAKHQAAKAALIYAMGLDWGTEVTISEPLTFDKPYQFQADTLIDEAKQFNPDISKLKLAIEAMDAKVDEANSEYMPQVGLFANRQYQDLGVDGGWNTSENRNNWAVGVGVRMSLFNGFATKNRVNSAKLQKIQLQEQFSLVESGIALLIKNKLTDLNKATTQVEIGERATKNASENVNLINRAFAMGAADAKDLVEAAYQNALIQSNLLKAKHRVLMSLAEIENTVGTEKEL